MAKQIHHMNYIKQHTNIQRLNTYNFNTW